jgi:hypothetical protein
LAKERNIQNLLHHLFSYGLVIIFISGSFTLPSAQEHRLPPNMCLGLKMGFCDRLFKLRDFDIQYDFNDDWRCAINHRSYGLFIWSDANRLSLDVERKLITNLHVLAGAGLSSNGDINFQFSPLLGVRYSKNLYQNIYFTGVWKNHFYSDIFISELEPGFMYSPFFLRNMGLTLEFPIHMGMNNSFSKFQPVFGLLIGLDYKIGF